MTCSNQCAINHHDNTPCPSSSSYTQQMAEKAGAYMEEHGVKFIRKAVPTKVRENLESINIKYSVCVCVCVHVCVICMWACVYVCVGLFMWCVSFCVCVCAYVCVHVCACVCVCVCVLCVCVCGMFCVPYLIILYLRLSWLKMVLPED